MTFLQANLQKYLDLPAPPHLRKGQWIFQVLHELDAEIYQKILGGEDDPFFDDERIERFLIRVGNEELQRNQG